MFKKILKVAGVAAVAGIIGCWLIDELCSAYVDTLALEGSKAEDEDEDEMSDFEPDTD